MLYEMDDICMCDHRYGVHTDDDRGPCSSCLCLRFVSPDVGLDNTPDVIAGLQEILRSLSC